MIQPSRACAAAMSKTARGRAFARTCAGAFAFLSAACGALIGVTDPELRNDAGSGSAGGRDAGSDAGVPTSCSEDLRKDPKNCGSCAHDCGGKTCNDGVCEGDDTSKPLGDIRQIVVGGDSIYIAQADGIYASKKTGEAVAGEKISDLKNARLSVDAKNLYAVGMGANANGTFVAVCLLPCSKSGDWRELSADATSVVVANEQPFLVGKGMIWKLKVSDPSIGIEAPLSASSLSVDETQGSRVHADAAFLYWTREGEDFLYLLDQSGNEETRRCNGINCKAGVVDVLVSNYTNTKKAFGVVVDANLLSVGYFQTVFQGGASLQVGGIKEIALAGGENASDFYARDAASIRLCSVAVEDTGNGRKVTCNSVTVSSPLDKPIVSMAVDGSTLYYAVVENAGTAQARGEVRSTK